MFRYIINEGGRVLKDNLHHIAQQQPGYDVDAHFICHRANII